MTYEPYQGLTVRKGDLEANVHFVRDGEVYYGVYRDGCCVGLYRKESDNFAKSMRAAVADGASVYSLVDRHECEGGEGL